MKKIVTQRSAEERAKFLKKNLHRAGLGISGLDTNPTPKVEKPQVNVHALIEEAITPPAEEEETPEMDSNFAIDEDINDDLDFDDDDNDDDSLNLETNDDDLNIDFEL